MCIQTHSKAFERILTHHDAFVCIHNRVASNGKARELLTTSGGAPKPEPELRVRVAQQARALGDLAGSVVVSMWIVEVLGANPHELRDLRGLLLGAAHLRGNVADVLGLDVAVLVALLRVHLLLQVGHLLDLLRGLAAGDDHRDRACIAMRVNASCSECIHTVMHMNAS